jgi:uncharacterized protein YndB with AHSA1/START domain
MSSTAETTSIGREITIAASPETVWGFLVEPDKATRWMGIKASLEARPGGVYRVEVIPGQTAIGEFVEVDPPHRVVFTWGWERGGESSVPPGSTTVEIELVPDGDRTILRFTHRDLPSAEAVRAHAHGWDHYLGRLATAAPGGDPGPDTMADQVAGGR